MRDGTDRPVDCLPADRQSGKRLAPKLTDSIVETQRRETPELARRIDPGECGLTDSQVIASRDIWGFNELPEPQRPMLWHRVARQFRELVIWVLLAAAIIAAVTGEWTDGSVILAIVVLNGTIGFLQEEKAGRALAALRKLSEPEAIVHRDGAVRRIPARELVPGDRITIASGDQVPADARLIKSNELAVQESVLTGESTPVAKDARRFFEPGTPLSERQCMIYRGTVVTAGNGEAVVVATGSRTEFGRIATLLSTVEPEPTPLQRRLAQLGRTLIVACLVVVAIVFVLHWVRGGNLVETFMTSVSLAVAAIPEGLPAVVTIAGAGPSAHGAATCVDPTAAQCRNTRLGLGYLRRQDRYAHAGRDDGGGSPGGRHRLRGIGIRLRA